MSVSSNDNFIDPSDVELEADEFNSDIEEKKEEIQELKDEVHKTVDFESQLETLEQELADIELEAKDILELHSDCEDYARGSSLINESYFTNYCEEFAYDCGEIDRDSSMSIYIDWDKYAEDCKMDYTTITFEGTDFYVQG
jgi:hypothetical protein